MPVYEYEHEGEGCELGRAFEWVQRITEDALAACPKCGGAVRRLISRTYVSAPKGNSDLKNMGFTKLVRRDTGVYENVTASGNEARYVESGKPETMPDLKRKISD